MREPIYKPKGRAGEYADYALNIYTGCPHGCTYCYAPASLRKSADAFGADVTVRKGLLQALAKQLVSEDWSGRMVHLCFTCDPYPMGVDATPTRESIRMLHESGVHVQVLTKNPAAARLDFDLLGPEDMFGVTVTGAGPEREPNSGSEIARIDTLRDAKARGIGTWVSCEPVYRPSRIYKLIAMGDFIDLFKIGKLNHRPSDIDWGIFGIRAEALCKAKGRSYVIKEDLRREIEKVG